MSQVMPAYRLIKAFSYNVCARLFLSLTLLLSNLAIASPKAILVLGDSLSAEYGIRRGTGWVTLMEERLTRNKISVEVINASISGETSSGGKVRLEALLDKFQPSVVIIELGGNDALRGLPLDASEANFRAMIDIAKQHKTKILLVGMRVPPNYGREYADRFFSIYTKLAKETKIRLVPFMLEGVADQPGLFQADRIHPTSEAQPTILNNIWPHVSALLMK